MTDGNYIQRNETGPQDAGHITLPNSLFFEKLLHLAQLNSTRVAISDIDLGIERTYLQLLIDVFALRNAIQESLSPTALADLSFRKDVYIALLAPGGYEYAVGFFAILCLGAAVVPLSTTIPVKEASYFVTFSQCVAVLTGSKQTQLGQTVARLVTDNEGTQISVLHIASNLQHQLNEVPSPIKIEISSDKPVDPEGAGLVIFTSGTTGPPKGAVHRREFIVASAEEVALHYQITREDSVLHVLPVHHATGILINFLPFILTGACVEFQSGSFDEQRTWERWRQGRGTITFFSGVPTIYMRMMRYFDQNIAKLDTSIRDEYVAGARQLRVLTCGSSAFPAPVEDSWARLLAGKRILTRYGSTEAGAVFMVGPADSESAPKGSVGKVVRGITVKLSDGDHGMVLLKGPHIFSGFLFDDKATAATRNDDGFFITGDIARREGPYYWILGRASIDIIKSGGYKISALDIERAILGLPYISEVMVVGVDDEEFGQRVAATISFRDSSSNEARLRQRRQLTITQFRNDLRSTLASYKLPTVLRIIEGELPKSPTGKVQKKILGPQYFPREYRHDPAVQTWSREPKL